MGAQNPLQGAIQFLAPKPPEQPKRYFDDAPTFQDFLDKTPDFDTYDEADKSFLANTFFKEKTADWNPDEAYEAAIKFNEHYGLPIDYKKPDWGTGFQDLLNNAVNTGSAGLIDNKLTDPEGLGAQAGAFLGPLVGTLGAVALAGETAGTSLALPAAYMGLVGAGNTARQQYNQSGYINNPLAVGTSGVTNAAFGLIPGVGQSLKAIPRMGLNAAIQGGAGALQDVAQQAAEQKTFSPQIDSGRLWQQAAMGAGMGAGFNAKGRAPMANPAKPIGLSGLPREAKASTPLYKGMPITRKNPVSDVAYQGANPIDTQYIKSKSGVENALQRAINTKRLDETATAQSKLSQLNNLYADVQAVLQKPEISPKTKAQYKAIASNIEAEYNSLKGSVTAKKQINDAQKKAEAQKQKINLIEAKKKAQLEVINNKTTSERQKIEAKKELERLKAELKAANQEQSYRNKEALQAKKQQKPVGKGNKAEAASKPVEQQKEVAPGNAKAKNLVKDNQVSLTPQADKFNALKKAVADKRLSPKDLEQVKLPEVKVGDVVIGTGAPLKNGGTYEVIKQNEKSTIVKDLNSESTHKLGHIDGKELPVLRESKIKELLGESGSEQKAQAKQQNGQKQPVQKTISEREAPQAKLESKTKEIESGLDDIYGKKEDIPGLDAISEHPEVNRRPEIINKISQAYKNKELVKFKYRAEIVGTDIDQVPVEGVYPYQVTETKSGSVMVRAIDSNGQIKAYKLFDGKDSSLIDSAQSTGKVSKYEPRLNPDKPKKNGDPSLDVWDLEANKWVDKTEVGTVLKTSQIESYRDTVIELSNRIKSGKPVSSKEIYEAGKLAKKVLEAEKAYEKMPEKSRKKIHKDITGEDC